MIKICKDISSVSNIYLQFSNSCWNYSDSTYYGLVYGTSFISLLKQNLLTTQGYLCCYCMKKISDESSTIEHLIPQNHNNTFAKYNFLNSSFIIDRQTWSDTIQIVNPTSCNGFPHDISYYNLVSSCNSNVTCNSSRGNNYIDVPFFDNNLSKEIVYETNGSIISVNSKYFNVIDYCQLNNTSYKIYRAIWMFIKKNNIGNLNVYAVNLEGLDAYILNNIDAFKDIVYDAVTSVSSILKDYSHILLFNDKNNASYNEMIKFRAFFFIN